MLLHVSSGNLLGLSVKAIVTFVLEAQADAIQCQINHRRGVKSYELAEEQSANDGYSEWAPQLRSHSGTDREWQRTENRGHGRHQDGTEAQHARLKDRVGCSFSFNPLGHQGKVDHHDSVLLN